VGENQNIICVFRSIDSSERHAHFPKQQSRESKQARPPRGAQKLEYDYEFENEGGGTESKHRISTHNKSLIGFRRRCPRPWPRAKGIGRLSNWSRSAMAQWWRFPVLALSGLRHTDEPALPGRNPSSSPESSAPRIIALLVASSPHHRPAFTAAPPPDLLDSFGSMHMPHVEVFYQAFCALRSPNFPFGTLQCYLALWPAGVLSVLIPSLMCLDRCRSSLHFCDRLCRLFTLGFNCIF